MENNKDTQKPARKPLGRGLAALLGESVSIKEPQRAPAAPSTPVTTQATQADLAEKTASAPESLSYFNYLETNKIFANPGQPRQIFNQAKLEELAKSIKEQGVIQPIVVRAAETGGFEIVAGERRWRAAQIAGLDKIPCLVRDEGELDFELVSIIENLQRENLTPVELAKAYEKAIKNKGLTQEQLSEKLGISRVALANTVRLLSLPEEVKSLLNQRLISEGHARALLGLENQELMSEMVKSCMEGGWSVRELEERVRTKKQSRATSQNTQVSVVTGVGAQPQSMGPNSAVMRALEDEFRQIFGTKVMLKGSSKKGRLEIHYSDAEALNRVISKLRSAK